MSGSKYRGHNIEYKNNKWIFSDTKQLVSDNPNRACGHCGKSQTENGHDACIPDLPGVMNACCGHGIVSEAYIQFENGECIRGKNAIDKIKLLKGDTL